MHYIDKLLKKEITHRQSINFDMDTENFTELKKEIERLKVRKDELKDDLLMKNKNLAENIAEIDNLKILNDE